jgi:protocatechuate 4,5-dioxygenase alpha chain
MTVNAIEKALWLASSNPAEAQRFREDAQSFMRTFRIDEEERALLTSWDVAAMEDRGVNPMVMMMGFMAVRGPSAMMEYLTKINQPRESATSR